MLTEGDVDLQDFLGRADVLAATGQTVLISDYFEYYRLAAYLSRYTKEPMVLAMGAVSLAELFDERYYENLEGGVLESLGRLFKRDLKLYVYPFRNPETQELITVETLDVQPPLHLLYRYLVERGGIVQLAGYNADYLPIFARDALRKIAAGEPGWESMVPKEVADLIKQRSLFGYTAPE